MGLCSSVATTFNSPLLLGGPSSVTWCWILGATMCFTLGTYRTRSHAYLPTARPLHACQNDARLSVLLRNEIAAVTRVPNSYAQFRRRDAKPEPSARMLRTPEYGIRCNVRRSETRRKAFFSSVSVYVQRASHLWRWWFRCNEVSTQTSAMAMEKAQAIGGPVRRLWLHTSVRYDRALTLSTGASIAEIVSAFPTCGGL